MDINKQDYFMYGFGIFVLIVVTISLAINVYEKTYSLIFLNIISYSLTIYALYNYTLSNKRRKELEKQLKEEQKIESWGGTNG
jgi:hypothetical protein